MSEDPDNGPQMHRLRALEATRPHFELSHMHDSNFVLLDDRWTAEERTKYGASLTQSMTSLCTVLEKMILHAQVPALSGILCAFWCAWKSTHLQTGTLKTDVLSRVVNAVVTSMIKNGILVALVPRELSAVSNLLRSALTLLQDLKNLKGNQERIDMAWVCISRLVEALKTTERVYRMPLDTILHFAQLHEARKMGDIYHGKIRSLSILRALDSEPVMRLAQMRGDLLVNEVFKCFDCFATMFKDLYKLIEVLPRTDQRRYSIATMHLYKYGLYRHRMTHETSQEPQTACGVGWAAHLPFQRDVRRALRAEPIPLNTDKVFDNLCIQDVKKVIDLVTAPSKKRARSAGDGDSQSTASVPPSVAGDNEMLDF